VLDKVAVVVKREKGSLRIGSFTDCNATYGMTVLMPYHAHHATDSHSLNNTQSHCCIPTVHENLQLCYCFNGAVIFLVAYSDFIAQETKP